MMILVLALLNLAGLSITIAAAAPDRPNLILIMADDLGYEALGCNGGTSYQTPLLDTLASKGMRFTHCYSQPVCTPSRVKIMTGQSNARNYREFGLLPAGEITFGNQLKAAGYRTCIAGKWQLSGDPGSKLKGAWWTDCGFDESCMWAYAHYLSKEDQTHWQTHSIFPEKKSTSRFWNPSILENGTYRPTTANDFGPDIYTNFIVDFIRDNREQPFFVYYPMALTHSPFVPTPHSKAFPEADKTKSNAKKYFGDMIRYTGHLVDRIINEVHQQGIAEKTLILFTTDNGTGRGIISRLGDRLIPGGKALPIDAGTHVPLIAYWHGTIQPGTVRDELIDFSDFLPTLVDAGRAKLPADRQLDGQSFLPLLKGNPAPTRNHVLIHYDKNPAAKEPKFRRVRFAYDGRYKLYDNGRLFHVPTDWDEEHPLDRKQLTPEQQTTQHRLRSAFAALPAWQPDNTRFGNQPDEETQKRLRLRDRLLQQQQNER